MRQCDVPFEERKEEPAPRKQDGCHRQHDTGVDREPVGALARRRLS